MRIQFQTEGGFAYIPGLNRPITIDTASLPPPEAARVEGLVHAANFFALPAQAGTAGAGAADYRTYTVTVEDGGQSHTVRAIDPVQDPSLRALIEHLRAQQGGPA